MNSVTITSNVTRVTVENRPSPSVSITSKPTQVIVRQGGGGGAPGPQGPPGKDGQIRFTGHGPPGVIVGAEPGDTYMDLTTGTVYKLGS